MSSWVSVSLSRAWNRIVTRPSSQGGEVRTELRVVEVALALGQVLTMKDTKVTVREDGLRTEWMLPYAVLVGPGGRLVGARSSA